MNRAYFLAKGCDQKSCGLMGTLTHTMNQKINLKKNLSEMDTLQAVYFLYTE